MKGRGNHARRCTSTNMASGEEEEVEEKVQERSSEDSLSSDKIKRRYYEKYNTSHVIFINFISLVRVYLFLLFSSTTDKAVWLLPDS